jgi:hypothetical protein
VRFGPKIAELGNIEKLNFRLITFCESVAMKTLRFLETCLIVGIASASMAQTPGRLIYTQLGASSTASETLSAIGNTVQVLQVAKTGSAQTPTSLMFLPNDASGIVQSGGSTSENSFTRSQTGRFAFLTGYAGPISTTRSGGSAATVNRIACRLDFTGAYNLSTRLTDAHTANNFRSAVLSETPISGNYKLWTVGANEGLRTANLGGTTSTLASITSTNLRMVDIVAGDLIIGTGSASGGVIGLRRITGTPTTTGNTMANLVSTNVGNTFNQASPYGFCFVGNTAVGGSLSVYIADDAAGVIKYTSTNGIAGPFTQAYRLTATAMRSLCTDGKVLYGVTGGNNNNQIQVIYDSGSAGSSFSQALIASVGTTNWVRGVTLAPEPTVVDCDYTSAPTAGNVMTLRTGDNAQRSLKVGLVPDSGPRSWTSLATVNYDGQAVKTAVDSSGNTYVLIQSETDGGSSTVVPTVYVSKVPAEGGTAVSSSVQIIPSGYEAYGITIDSSNRPIVAYRPASGTQETRFVRWSTDLSTATVFDNSATGFSNGSKTPVDIASDPNNYLSVLFGTANNVSTLPFSNSFVAGSATSDVAIAAESGNALQPLSAQFGSDGNLRILSVGATPATRALFRIDTLNATLTAVSTTGTSYRRDVAGGATSPSLFWANGLSMGGNAPRVLMVGTSEPATGPAGQGTGTANRNDQILGAGRVWTFNSSNAVTYSSYRFAPGFAPVN